MFFLQLGHPRGHVYSFFFFKHGGCVCDIINMDIQGKFTDAQNELILMWMNSEYTAL